MTLLAGTVVVVSGVGPGLGRSIALASARAGADVVLAARTASRLDEVAKEVTALGRRGVAVPADVTDGESAARLAEAALAAFGRVDTLVHNAFAIPPLTSLADADLDAIRAAVETNAVAALRLTRLFTPALAAGRRIGRDDQLGGAAPLPAGLRRVQDGQDHTRSRAHKGDR
jgi:NAD(P)-dependent dehydrogenase (short-subunit alcohol dehydrogenase family)